MKPLADDGDHVRCGNLRGISILDHKTGVWVDDVAAVVTSEEELSQGLTRLPSDAGVELLLETTSTPRTSELGVELVLFGGGISELVVVPLDEFPDE